MFNFTSGCYVHVGILLLSCTLRVQKSFAFSSSRKIILLPKCKFETSLFIYLSVDNANEVFPFFL